MDKEVRPFQHKTPTVEQMTDQLKKLGVGKDSKVICYDNVDGTMAARGAFLLSVFGVKDVSVLNGSFKSWCPESVEALKEPERATGANFEFVLDKSYFATPDEI